MNAKTPYPTSVIEFGHFIVKSAELWVTDPAYEAGTWCQGKLINVANGRWQAEILWRDEGDWGRRVMELRICSQFQQAVGDWKKLDADIGVDSGGAGFFDTSYIIGSGRTETRDSSAFYQKYIDLCCGDGTDKYLGGVMEHGAVSCSGHGDGGYDCFYRESEKGEVAEAKIVFLTNADD